MHLEDLLTEMGHVVVEIATRVPRAIEVARNSDIDFAVLDVNVGGTTSFAVADVLRGRGILFVFATGYGSPGLQEGYRDVRTLQKPYAPAALQQVIDQLLP